MTFDRLDERIKGPVVDSIMVYPRGHGVLSLPGEYGTGQPPPRHHYDSAAISPDGYYVELVQRGGPDRYFQTYKVSNYKDSPVFVDLILDDPAWVLDWAERSSRSSR